MCSHRERRGAFSLAELVVSIGILVLMLSLVGQIFNITIKSTGQAMALTQTSQLLRAFEQSLREDLAGVQRGRSLLLIQGNPVNAYWTQEGKEADDNADPRDGYPHAGDPSREDANGRLVKPRADVLMFFTARQAASAVYPGVASRLQQVVYGHAQLGEYVPTGDDPPYDFPDGFPDDRTAFPVDSANKNYPSTTLVSPVSAERWHLARRGVLLMSVAPPPGADPPWAQAKTNPLGEIVKALEDSRILQGETDVIGNFSFEEYVLTPAGTGRWYLPHIFDPGADPTTGRVGGDEIPHARTQLDTTPPPLYANRLAAYFLPKCASFKVEWSLDPRSAFVAGRLAGTKEVYWFDPGRFDSNDLKEHPLKALETALKAAQDAFNNATDPAKQKRLKQLYLNLESLLDVSGPHPDGDEYSLSDRFLPPELQGERIPGWDPERGWADGRPNMVVFGAGRRKAGADNEIVPEDIFPVALRITIDLFDSERRLERPIRHVMVIPVGG